MPSACSGSCHNIFGLYMNILLYDYPTTLQVIKISVPSSCTPTPPVRMQNRKHQLASQTCKTHNLCRELLLRQERFEEFLTEQLHDMHASLNDLLTLLPAHPHNSRAHTPPIDERRLDETFSLPLTSTPVVSAARTPPEQVSEDQSGLPVPRLLTLRSDSCSRENFAARLNKELFAKEERMPSNVKGVFGKKKLDVEKVRYIQQQALELFPLTAAENKQRCWARCIRAIDSCNRQLVRAVRKSVLLQEKENVPTED